MSDEPHDNERTVAHVTPGPWAAENVAEGTGCNAWGVVSASGRIVVLHDFVGEADAKFIAAAPDLLLAVRLLLCEVDDSCRAAIVARQALAKAGT